MTPTISGGQGSHSTLRIADPLHRLQDVIDGRNIGASDFLLEQEARYAPDRAPDFTLHAAMAIQHLELLGRDESDTNIRAIPHKGMKGATAFNGLFARDCERIEKWQRSGRGIYLQPNPGGTTAKEVKCGSALFNEFDDRPVDKQVDAWFWLGLPEPTFQLLTGGKSCHTYWVLESPIAVSTWDELTERLIHYSGSDKSVKGANRMMRMAGAWYIDNNGRPTARSEIINATGKRYTAQLFQELLPPLQKREKRAHQGPPRIQNQAKSKNCRQIIEALDRVPRRIPGHNTYSDYRDLLWGLCAAVEEIGGDRRVAIDLMEDHSPSDKCGWDVSQVANSGGDHIGPGTFWYQVRNLAGGSHA